MKTVCIDIDGTISRYVEWVDSKTFGKVLPHCAETIHHLKADGWYVIIYTTRADKKEIADYLTANNIPFDSININPNQPDNAQGGKPIADVYVDDRAIQFDGDWAGAYEKITRFSSWEEKSDKSNEAPLDYCGQLLIADFSQSMEMHRHYDSLNWQITKFSCGEILVAIGACWSVFNWDLSSETTPNLKWLVMSLICLTSWLFGVLSIYTIVKNRLYFVRTARHINELRHHVLQKKPYGFTNKANFWEDAGYPKVKDWCSTQFVSLYTMVLLTMAVGFFTIYAFQGYNQIQNILWPFMAALFTLVICFVIVKFAAKETF